MRRTRRRLSWFAVLLIATSSLSAQSNAARLVTEADTSLAAGRYFEAIETYQTAIQENPNYLHAVLGLAEAYYWLEEYDQAQHFVDRARRLARSGTAVMNLAARVAIGRGDLAAAEAGFRSVQRIEPNNVDASIGLAELSLARGQGVEAAGYLERALRLNPDHRKALLSLVLVYEHLGEDEIARRYLDVARSVHHDRAEVHTLAAEYHIRAGELEQAARAARTAQAIAPMNRSATAIRAEIAVLQQSYAEALAVAEELIASDRSDTRAWYLRAVSKYRLGALTDALTSIRTALRIAPDNEMFRIWAEWLAMEELPLDHPVRSELAAARATTAAELVRTFRYDRALKSYRRAVQLTPLDLDLRRDYAELFRSMGHLASYLQELRVIRDNGRSDPETDRRIEVFENALSSGVASRWGIDQFTISRTRTPIGLYLTEGNDYPESEAAILAFIRRALVGLERIEVAQSTSVDTYADAFRSARSQGVDFFAQLGVAVTDRAFSVHADLFIGRTGSHAAGLGAARSGPDNASAAVDAFTDRLVAALPERGSIVRRRGRAVVIDRGSRDGLEVGAQFDVIGPGQVSIAPDRATLVYRPESIVGTVTITAVDDLVAEGDLVVRGVGDLVRSGDVVVRADAEPPTDGESAVDLFPLLYERVRRLR